MLIESEDIEIKRNGSKQQKQFNTYICDWCSFKFYKTVGSLGGEPMADASGRKHKKYSSQIMCPSCGNFIKTWE